MQENILKLKEVLRIVNIYSKGSAIPDKVCRNLESCGYELEKVINDLEECKETLEQSNFNNSSRLNVSGNLLA